MLMVGVKLYIHDCLLKYMKYHHVHAVEKGMVLFSCLVMDMDKKFCEFTQLYSLIVRFVLIVWDQIDNEGSL